MILMPTGALCQQVNQAMMQQIGNQIYYLLADDSLDSIVDKPLLVKVHKAYQKLSDDSTRTAGLEKKLELCIGARVMLKRNRDIEAGLVNGSVGTVVGFNTTLAVNSVKVKFDRIDSPIDIERLTFSFEVLKGVYYIRKQFPLMAAFAITIHKSQGLSLKCAIIDAGPTTFGSGMVYVALSRVTSLDGLHLIDLDRSRIKCDKKAIVEYNRLRKLYTDLGEIHNCNSVNELNNSQATTNSSKKRSTGSTTTNQTSLRCKLSPDRCRLPEAVKATTTDNKHQGRKRRTIENVSTEAKLPKMSRLHENDSDDNAIAVVATTQRSIYLFCQIASLQIELQQCICQRFNLEFISNELPKTAVVEKVVSNKLIKQIRLETTTRTNARIHQIIGDGNCLFRGISLGITGTQSQHSLIRAYIVNHMLHSDVQEQLEQSFETRTGTAQTR